MASEPETTPQGCLWTSHIKTLAGKLEGAHSTDPLAREAATALRALAAERDSLRKLTETQEALLARKA